MSKIKGFITPDKTINILTFQSQEVLDIIRTKHHYEADSFLKREDRNYHEDIKQLGGKNPIWGFKSLKDNHFNKSDLLNGELLHRFRCEMSINHKDLSNLTLLDLTIDINKVKPGITHNAYSGAIVFPEININELNAVYRIDYGNTLEERFLPTIKVIEIFNGNSILKSDLKCKEEE